MTKICVQDLFIYPFKGLSAQKCACVELEVGHGIRGDRTFALMFKQDAQYPDTTKVPWMKKHNFAMQNDWGGLAALDCAYEAATSTLRVKRKGVDLADSAAKEFSTHTDGCFGTGDQWWYSSNWRYFEDC